jgi:outer membrane protein TolC
MVVAAVLAGSVVGAADHELTLEEAIGYALQKNDSIIVERENLVSARAQEKGARGIYDPDLKVNVGWRNTTDPVNSSFSGAPLGKNAPNNKNGDFAASVDQLLPTGGHLEFHANSSRQASDGTFSLLSPAYFTQVGVQFRQPLQVLLPSSTNAAQFTVRAAHFDRQGAEAALRRDVADAVAAVERGYWALKAARLEVGVGEEAVKLAQEQLQETELRVEQGVSAEAEKAQPRAELERRRGELFASHEAVARADNALKLLILSDGDAELWATPLDPVDKANVEALSVDLEAWMQRALGSRPELRVAEAVLQRRSLEASLARDQVRPSLDAIVSYDRLGLAGTRNPAVSPAPGAPPIDLGGLEGGYGNAISSLTDGGFSDLRFELQFQMPIGNRTAKAAAAVAASTSRQAQTQLVQARKAVRAEVLDAAAALQTTWQRIAAARAAREAAEVQLSAERERFTAGLSTNFLVLTRQNDLSRARLDEISSVHDYQNARTQVARATGSLLEERRIAVEEK